MSLERKERIKKLLTELFYEIMAGIKEIPREKKQKIKKLSILIWVATSAIIIALSWLKSKLTLDYKQLLFSLMTVITSAVVLAFAITINAIRVKVRSK